MINGFRIILILLLTFHHGSLMNPLLEYTLDLAISDNVSNAQKQRHNFR